MVRLLVKVKPGSGKDEITADAEGNLSVKIKAKPIDGEANDYLIKYLSKEFDISRSSIQLEKGAASRLKRIVLDIEKNRLSDLLKRYIK